MVDGPDLGRINYGPKIGLQRFQVGGDMLPCSGFRRGLDDSEAKLFRDLMTQAGVTDTIIGLLYSPMQFPGFQI